PIVVGGRRVERDDANPCVTAPRGREGSLCRGAEIVVPDEIVLLELRHGPALEHDLAVDDDVAAVCDAYRLVEILLGHQYREPVALLQLPDLRDGMRHEYGGEPHRG